MTDYTKHRVWQCRIGDDVVLPNGADAPMRAAVRKAFHELTGVQTNNIFSGWGERWAQQEINVMTGTSSYTKASRDELERDLAAARAEIESLDRKLKAGWIRVCQTSIGDVVAENKALRTEIEAMRELLRRYRDEVPLGHQPHMIAHEVDAAIDREQEPPR